jgi:undecaprenyl-diphosphatase
MTLDTDIFQFIHAFAGRSILADNVAVLAARYVPYLLVIGFFMLLMDVRGARRRVFFFAQTAIIALVSRGVIVETIRFFYDRPRPFEQLGFEPLISQSALEPSFPSGHAAFFFGLAIAVWQVSRMWGIWYLAAAALNGIARVFSGVHWPLDVAAGALIGIIAAVCVAVFMRRYYPHPPEVLLAAEAGDEPARLN